MDPITYVDFLIEKAERQADGSVLVSGPCTTDDIDSDRQIVDPEFAAKGLGEWFQTGANVREMHQAKAIGSGVELKRQGNQHWLTSRILEPVAANLAFNKVLRAYSVGISGAKLDFTKNPQARGGTIVDGTFVEVSLVDRPANAFCKVDLVTKMADGSAHFTDIVSKDDDGGAKACPTCKGKKTIMDGNRECPDCGGTGEMSAEKLYGVKAREARYDIDEIGYSAKRSFDRGVGEHGTDRDTIAAEDFAGPHRSFPIVSAGDVKDAWDLAGHADDPDAVRQKIKEIAGRKGFALPEGAKVEKKKGKVPDVDQRVTEDLADATEAQAKDNAMHEAGGTEEDEEDASKLDQPYVIKRLHDFLCPAFSTDALKSVYPTVARFGDVVDPQFWAERVTDIVGLDAGTGQYARDLSKASQLYGLAIQFAKADDDVVMEARAILSKAFSDMYPSIHLSPTEITPGQFKRPYISSGRANQTAKPGQKPRMPMSTNVPSPNDFDRGYLTDGRAANSPSAGPPNSPSTSKIEKFECVAEEVSTDEGVTVVKITHTPTGLIGQGVNQKDAWKALKQVNKERQFYTNNARDGMLQTIQQAHDLLAGAHPTCCPMKSESNDHGNEPIEVGDDTMAPVGSNMVDNQATSVPTAKLLTKIEGEPILDIQKMVDTAVERIEKTYKKRERKLEKSLKAKDAEITKLAEQADPEMVPFRGGRGVIPFAPKREEVTQGSEAQAEVEKRNKVEWFREKLSDPSLDMVTKSRVIDELSALLDSDQVAALLVTTKAV